METIVLFFLMDGLLAMLMLLAMIALDRYEQQ